MIANLAQKISLSRPGPTPSFRTCGVLSQRNTHHDTLFEQETLPARMAVIGLGPIGIEMAQSLSRLGIEVVAFEAGMNIGGLGYPRVNATAIDILRREFSVHLGEKADLEAVKGEAGGGVRVRAKESEAVQAHRGGSPGCGGLWGVVIPTATKA